MSCLRYLCLLAYSGVQRMLFFPGFVYPILPVSLDCQFRLPLRYSLTFILACFLLEVATYVFNGHVIVCLYCIL